MPIFPDHVIFNTIFHKNWCFCQNFPQNLVGKKWCGPWYKIRSFVKYSPVICGDWGLWWSSLPRDSDIWHTIMLCLQMHPRWPKIVFPLVLDDEIELFHGFTDNKIGFGLCGKLNGSLTHQKLICKCLSLFVNWIEYDNLWTNLVG